MGHANVAKTGLQPDLKLMKSPGRCARKKVQKGEAETNPEAKAKALKVKQEGKRAMGGNGGITEAFLYLPPK